jgi:hypothetical protein
MDDDASFGVTGGSTTLEQCVAAVQDLDGREGCLGDCLFFESAGYCNCPMDTCDITCPNANAGGDGQLYCKNAETFTCKSCPESIVVLSHCLGALGWVHWITFHIEGNGLKSIWDGNHCWTANRAWLLTLTIILAVVQLSGGAFFFSRCSDIGCGSDRDLAIVYTVFGCWGVIWTVPALIILSCKSESIQISDEGSSGGIPYGRMTVRTIQGSEVSGEAARFLLDSGRFGGGIFGTKKWNVSGTRGTLEVTVTPAVRLSRYALRSANDFAGRDPSRWSLYGVSSSGEKQLLHQVQQNRAWSGQRWAWKDWEVDNLSHTFDRFRFEIQGNNGDSCTQLGQLRLWESATSASVAEVQMTGIHMDPACGAEVVVAAAVVQPADDSAAIVATAVQPASSSESLVDRLKELQRARDGGLLTAKEHADAKAACLRSHVS